MLTKCPECGHGVSTEALACPNCGKPRPPKGWPEEETTPSKDVMGTFLIGVPLIFVIASLLLKIFHSGQRYTGMLVTLGILISMILGVIESASSNAGAPNDIDENGKRYISRGTIGALIILFWIIGYPFWMKRRERYGKRDLLIPAIAIVVATMLMLIVLLFLGR